MQPFIVGIRFQKIGKIYHFDASSVSDIQVGDHAVVETSRGRQLGEVIQIVSDPPPPPEGAWKPIMRRATPRDLVLRQLWQKKELEAMINCRAKNAEYRTDGVKIIAAEYTFDGSRLSFLYSTETEAKVDLKKLRNAMQRLYPRSLVDMRLVGPRDVAKILGGMGACGLENRCCSTFLTEFSPISIKMAKEQGISLTPSEITGMCGRLRCCLVYEYEQYVEARKTLPKRNKRVMTPNGEGRVYDIFPLKQAVLVEYEDGVRREFLLEAIQPLDELEALRKKAESPCDKHPEGGCSCGKTGPAELKKPEIVNAPDAGSDAEHPESATNDGTTEVSPARAEQAASRPEPRRDAGRRDRPHHQVKTEQGGRSGGGEMNRQNRGGPQGRQPGSQPGGEAPQGGRPKQHSRPKPKKQKMPPPNEAL